MRSSFVTGHLPEFSICFSMSLGTLEPRISPALIQVISLSQTLEVHEFGLRHIDTSKLAPNPEVHKFKWPNLMDLRQKLHTSAPFPTLAPRASGLPALGPRPFLIDVPRLGREDRLQRRLPRDRAHLGAKTHGLSWNMPQ